MINILNTLKEQTTKFLETYVVGKMKNIHSMSDINYDNIGEIVDFIEQEYEIPEASLKNDHLSYNFKLLDEASKAVDDITTQPWW